MAAALQSPIRYILSLEVPQAAALEVTDRRERLNRPGCIAAPMKPLLPLLETGRAPRPPVPGLLPRCPAAPSMADSLILSRDRRWWIRPVDGGGWFENLASALIESGGSGDGPDPVASEKRLFPSEWGIPVAVLLEDIGEFPDFTECSGILKMTARGWRAMVLHCHEIRWNPDRTWYLDLRWRTVWTRRLGRSPAMTNNSKNT